MPETRINTGFRHFNPLFKLNRSGRLTGNIIHYPIHMAHLIDDPAGHLLQYFIRDLCALCGHEVDGLHGSQCDGVIIGSLITHNAYGSHIGQGCEVLVDLAVQTCVSDFLAVDGICILYDLDLLSGHFADDTDTQSGTGERLTEYQMLRNAKLQSYLADLILEQVAQRLDDLLGNLHSRAGRLRCDGT